MEVWYVARPRRYFSTCLGVAWSAPRDVFLLVAAFIGEQFALLQYSWARGQVNRPALWSVFSIREGWASWHRLLDQMWPATMWRDLHFRIPFSEATESYLYQITFLQDRRGIPTEDQVEMLFLEVVDPQISNYGPWPLVDPCDDAVP